MFNDNALMCFVFLQEFCPQQLFYRTASVAETCYTTGEQEPANAGAMSRRWKSGGAI